MCVILGVLFVFVGILTIIYSYKHRAPINKNAWDAVMSYRGYLGGFLFILIGIVKLISCDF